MNPGFKDKNASLQFLIVVGLCFVGLILALLIGGLLTTLIFPIQQEDIQGLIANPESALGREISRFLQGVLSIGLFLIPALFAAKLFSDAPEKYLALDTLPKPFLLLVGLLGLLTLAGLGVSDALYQLTKAIPLPASLLEYFTEQEALMQNAYALFLEMPNTLAFVKAFILIAVLPAVCEETLFRGVLQPIFKKGTRNVHVAVWLTAATFSIIHFNYYGLFSIFILGGVLGYLREWTGSLWVSILLHLFNNGIIVCAVYFGGVSYDELNQNSFDVNSTWLTVASIIGFLLLLFLIKKSFSKSEV